MSNTNLESYPPPFRPSSKPLVVDPPADRVDDDDTDDSAESDSDPIPIIDFQSLVGLNKDNNDCNKLGEACKDWGLFRLVNHGVPPDLLNKLEDYARELFYLSFESKQALFTTTTPNLSYFWGTPALTPSGAALSRDPQNINWVEGLNIPLSGLSQLQPQQHPTATLTSFR